MVDGKRYVVLVVDDEIGIRGTCRSALECDHHSVLLSGGIRETKEILEERGDIDAAFVDWGVERGKGDNDAVKLGDLYISPMLKEKGIPYCIMSGTPYTNEDDKGYDERLDELYKNFMAKPFSLDGILQILERVVGG